MLIRSKIPFYKQVPLYALKIKKVIYKSPSPALTTKFLSSPRILTKFAPVSPMIRQNKSNLNPNSILNRLTINPSTFKEKKQEESKVKPPKGRPSRYILWIDNSKAKNSPLPTDMNTEGIRLPNSIKDTHSTSIKPPTTAEVVKSPSLFLKGISKTEEQQVLYCECGSLCKEGENLCDTCLKRTESVEYSGYLYVKEKNNQLKRYWYTLLNKDLYCNNILIHYRLH